MKKIFLVLFLALLVLACSEKEHLSEADRARVEELNRMTLDFVMAEEFGTAKRYCFQALQIDAFNLHSREQLAGIYVLQDSLDKALAIWEAMPTKQKKYPIYNHVKASLYDFIGQMENAEENYKLALKKTKRVKVKGEMDLMPLVDYAMLEALSGNKQRAVSRLNEALTLPWLSESNREYLETFRNEFEYYQGNGSIDFSPTQDYYIRTTQADSLSEVLKKNHINNSGSTTRIGDTTEIYFAEKYRAAIEALGFQAYKYEIATLDLDGLIWHGDPDVDPRTLERKE